MSNANWQIEDNGTLMGLVHTVFKDMDVTRSKLENSEVNVVKLQKENEVLKKENEELKLALQEKTLLIANSERNYAKKVADSEIKTKTDVGLWLREQYELALSVLDLIDHQKAKIKCENIISPAICGSFLTILFMNAFGIKANVGYSDLEIMLFEYNDCPQKIKSKIMDFMESELLKNLLARLNQGKHNPDVLVFGQYLLQSMTLELVDVEENVNPKLTIRFVHSSTKYPFTVNILGWYIKNKLSINAEGFYLSSSNGRIDHELDCNDVTNSHFKNTLYRISKGETLVTKNVYKLNVEHASLNTKQSSPPFNKLTEVLTQGLPSAVMLGLTVVGEDIPYISTDLDTELLKIELCCKTCDPIQENIVSALEKIKNNVLCSKCGNMYYLSTSSVEPDVSKVKQLVIDTSKKFVIHVRHDGTIEHLDKEMGPRTNKFLGYRDEIRVEALLKD